MFTLKLYRNGDTINSRVVIIETCGIWIDHNGKEGDPRRILAFKKQIGVMDEEGTPEFYVGGRGLRVLVDEDPVPWHSDNYFAWAVLENAQGKTTEMFR